MCCRSRRSEPDPRETRGAHIRIQRGSARLVPSCAWSPRGLPFMEGKEIMLLRYCNSIDRRLSIVRYMSHGRLRKCTVGVSVGLPAIVASDEKRAAETA